MRTIRLAVTALVVSAFLAACAESPTGTESPQFSIADAPAESGIIVRGGFNAAVSWVDAKSGMRVIIGLDIVDLCTGPFTFDFFSFQDLNLPNGRIVEIVQGEDIQTSVWGFLPFDCGQFTTVAPLASGLSDMVVTDNDLFGVAPGDKNANAFGFRAHGSLTRPSGADAAFSAHLNIRFGNHQGGQVKAKISLH